MDATCIPGSLAQESNWESGWDVMEHLIYRSSQQAVDRITSDLVRTANVKNLPLKDLLKQKRNDWEFIEQFTHLYQVHLYKLIFILVLNLYINRCRLV